MIETYMTVLPVILYGCKTWSLTLTDEYKMGVFKRVVLSRTLKLEDMDVKWGLGKRESYGFHNL
jgi:hypothetical protein